MPGKMKGQEERTTVQPGEETTPARPPLNELLRFGFPFLGPRGPLGTPLYVRTYVRKKNLDQQYSSMYASQTHITIHIQKDDDMYYPLMPP